MGVDLKWITPCERAALSLPTLSSQEEVANFKPRWVSQPPSRDSAPLLPVKLGLGECHSQCKHEQKVFPVVLEFNQLVGKTDLRLWK